MSRFSELIDQLSDQKNYSLSDVLLKAKVLAHQLKSPQFREWNNSEIEGYPSGATLPDYRLIPCTVRGDFYGPFQSRVNNVNLSMSHLAEKRMREHFSTARMNEGVAEIENLSTGECGRPLDIVEIDYLRKHGVRVDGHLLNAAISIVPQNALRALLASVRNRLLDFLLELSELHPELQQDDAAVARLSEADVEAAFGRKVYQNCNFYTGTTKMRDSYQANQAGAMGPGSKAENINFVQVLRTGIGANSLGDLAQELEQLRTAMLTESKSPEQDESVSAVAQAEDAAKKGDSKGVLSSLKSAGKWALDVAQKVGTPIASKAIEAAIGLS